MPVITHVQAHITMPFELEDVLVFLASVVPALSSYWNLNNFSTSTL